MNFKKQGFIFDLEAIDKEVGDPIVVIGKKYNKGSSGYYEKFNYKGFISHINEYEIYIKCEDSNEYKVERSIYPNYEIEKLK